MDKSKEFQGPLIAPNVEGILDFYCFLFKIFIVDAAS
jgi:hypothetical protein